MPRSKAKPKIRKVVLDVNILVSAFFYPAGKPRHVWELAERRKIISVTCDQMIGKLLEVITRPKFDKYDLTLAEKIGFAARVRHFSSLVMVSGNLQGITVDPEDDIVLECAMNGSVEYIITGDPHLKRLERYRKIEIITVSSFLEVMRA